MENIFRKESPRFDGTNYDNQKDKMKTHLLCMGPGYWLVTKISKTITEEDQLETWIKEQREVFMCNIRAREELLLELPESEYSQVKLLKKSHEIWKTLKANYEGDTHAKELDCKICIANFKMLE